MSYLSVHGDGPIGNSSEGPRKSEDMFNAELAAEMVKRTDKLLDNNLDMAVRLRQAREFMAWSAHHLRELWLDWQDEASGAARNLNEFRMMFERESKTLVAAGKDVREFFNSAEYLKAQGALKETLELLERLGKLKQDGTLDALGDFILRVTCK